MRNRILFVCLCSFLTPIWIFAQKDSTELLRTYSYLLGYGQSRTVETYLSNYLYTGTNYRMMGERLSFHNEGKTIVQNFVSLDYAQTANFSGRGSSHQAFIEYSYGRHFQYLNRNHFRLFVGPAIDMQVGCIYNTRNGNNPAQAKIAANTLLSSLAEYKFRIKNFPLRASYQLRIPVIGVGFAPDFGASYYEMFGLKNTNGIVAFLSIHNQYAMQNLVTIEFPLFRNSMRFGYFNSIYQTRIKDLETSIVSHNFVIGYTGDILLVNRNKHKK